MIDDTPFGDRLILLVEDSENDAYLMQFAFRKCEVTNPIQILRNGEEAIAYLSGSGDYSDRDRFPIPFVILLDLNMPRMNGIEFLKWLREQPFLRRLTVDALTASERPDDIERAFEEGLNAYFVKPGRVEQLVELIGTWYRLLRFRAFPKCEESGKPAKVEEDTRSVTVAG